MEENLIRIFKFVMGMLTLPKFPNPAEWASKHIRLGQKVSQENGWWSLHRNPEYEPILEFIREPISTTLVLVFGTQLGKTTLLFIIIAYNIVFRRAPAIFAFPSEDDAKYLVKTRWKQIVEDSPVLKDSLLHYETLLQEFQGAALRWVGSNSPTKLQSYPARLVVMDEVGNLSEGRVDDDRVDTGAVVSLMERNKDYIDPKTVLAGSPKKFDDILYSFLQKSTWMVCELPSPHASDKYFVLDFFKGILPTIKEIYDDKGKLDLTATLATVGYICPFTGKLISDKDKLWMRTKFKWTSTNPTANQKIKGYQLSTMYSAKKTWRDIAEAYFTLRDEPGGLAQFYNGWLALPYAPESDTADEKVLKDRSDGLKDDKGAYIVKPYERGTVPEGVTYKVISADHQKKNGDHFVWTCMGYDTRNQRAYVIDWGIEPGHIQELQAIYAQYDCDFGVIDVGNDTQQLAKQIFSATRPKPGQKPQKWAGIKGHDTLRSGLRQEWKEMDAYLGDPRLQKHGLDYIHISTNNEIWYEELARLRSGKKRGFFLPVDIDQALIDGLTSVSFQTVKDKRGRETTIIKEDETKNHLWDAIRYNLSTSDYRGKYGVQIRPPKRRSATKIFRA